MKYRIAFIDDEEDVIRQFKINTMGRFEVIDIDLKEDIDEIIHDIKEKNLNALIIDYLLNITKSHIHFNGVDVIKRLLDEQEDFPCFVLTSYESEAEDTEVNPDMVYPKEQVNIDPERFNRKINRKIENYNKRIDSYHEELIMLFNKIPNLSLSEEERLIELDTLIEKSINKKMVIPKTVKKISNDERLYNLIIKTESLLKEIEDD